MQADSPRILLLTKRFPPQYTGGVPNYYKNLLQHLNKVEAFVITSWVKKQQHFDSNNSGEKGCFVKRVDFFPENMGLQLNFTWLWSLARMVQAIVKTVKTNHIDIIIVGQVQMFLLMSAFIASILIRKPYILFLHGEEIPQIYLRSNRLLRYLYLQASCFFCNSGFTAARLQKFVKSNRVKPITITPGVEDRFFQKAEFDNLKENLGLEEKRIVYTIARLDERKGQDMVIKALPLIIKKYPDVVYLIGGKGLRLNYLKNLVSEIQLADYVRFLGFVSEDDLVLYHYIGDIFVMPNRILADGDTEGFGIVFLEANAAGNPVIGGDEGGSVDAIIDGVTGYLVNPRDKQDIADRICMLLENDGLCRKMGRAGRERAWKEFRWPTLAKKFEDFVIELFNKLP